MIRSGRFLQLVAAACLVVAPVLESSVNAALPGVTKVKGWSGNGDGVIVDVTDDGLVTMEVVGKSNLGRFTGIAQHQLSGDGSYFQGAAVWVFRGGDELWVFYDGEFSDSAKSPNAFSGFIWTFGGTGQFETALGGGEFFGDVQQGVVEFRFKGTIGHH